MTIMKMTMMRRRQKQTSLSMMMVLMPAMLRLVGCISRH